MLICTALYTAKKARNSTETDSTCTHKLRRAAQRANKPHVAKRAAKRAVTPTHPNTPSKKAHTHTQGSVKKSQARALIQKKTETQKRTATTHTSANPKQKKKVKTPGNFRYASNTLCEQVCHIGLRRLRSHTARASPRTTLVQPVAVMPADASVHAACALRCAPAVAPPPACVSACISEFVHASRNG